MVKNVCCIVSVCMGFFILVEVGLFDGKLVIIYWVVVEDFCVWYFEVCFIFEWIYVKFGNIYIVVGVIVVMDFVIVFVEEDLGVELVRWVV